MGVAHPTPAPATGVDPQRNSRALAAQQPFGASPIQRITTHSRAEWPISVQTPQAYEDRAFFCNTTASTASTPHAASAGTLPATTAFW